MYSFEVPGLQRLGWVQLSVPRWWSLGYIGLAGGGLYYRPQKGSLGYMGLRRGRPLCSVSELRGLWSLEAFAFRLKAYWWHQQQEGDKGQILKLQRSSNQMLFVARGSSYMTSEFGEVFWHSDFSEQLIREIKYQSSKPSPIIITIIVMVIKIIIIDIVMVIGLQATLRGQSQVCRSWLYTNPPETIETIETIAHNQFL